MANGRKGIGDLISTITVAVLFLVILLLVVFSAASYRHATDVEAGNSSKRALLSYVASAIRDSRGKDIKIEDKDDGDAITITSPGSRFERRIYLQDGRLYEEYAEDDIAPDPENALVIGETEKFDVEQTEDGLVSIMTDAGTSYVGVK